MYFNKKKKNWWKTGYFWVDISNTPGLLSVQRWNGSLLYFIILYYYTLYIDKILTIVVKCFSPLLLKIILETKKNPTWRSPSIFGKFSDLCNPCCNVIESSWDSLRKSLFLDTRFNQVFLNVYRWHVIVKNFYLLFTPIFSLYKLKMN